MADDQGTRHCPYCKEEIKSEAIKCKHCGSKLAAEKPSHGGTCPYCKESIHPEAIRCKHCHSMLGNTDIGSSQQGHQHHHHHGHGGCGCGCADCAGKHHHGRHHNLHQGGAWSPGSPAAVGQVLARINTGGFGGRGQLGELGLTDCYSVCSGSTLWCVCTVRGTNWISMFPCGSCIDDGPILA